MSELDEAGRVLIALASDAHHPTDADRARVRAALAARLGAAAGLGIGATAGLTATAKAAAGASGVGSTGTATAAVTGGALATKLVGVAVAITATVAVGATVKLARHVSHSPAAITASEVHRHRTLAAAPREIPAREPAAPPIPPPAASSVAEPPSDRPPPAPARLATAAPQARAELAAPAAPEPAPPSEPSPGPGAAPPLGPHETAPKLPQLPPREVRATAPPRRSAPVPASAPACMSGPSGQEDGPRRPEFTVADEARLVRDGVRALREGQAACALSLLDTHARYYPEGVLAEEREAERALALADLGRIADARAAATAFLRKHPASPLGARLKQHIPGLER